ncbi:MAG TPA: neutral zinc metallopeptidase [Flavipsychrobacter sp.]|nr:neutral zinc metallopeptidase [Flavipsychrobacter sp.]
MRWNGRRSGNVEDARGGGAGKVVGGGIGALVIGVIIYLLGGDPSAVMTQMSSGGEKTEEQKRVEDVLVDRTKQILAYTEDVWDSLFQAHGQTYQKPVLQVFDFNTESGCGSAGSSTGPFYCPLDQKAYMDLSFFREMEERFGVGGDFPMAYVIAHEIGHHVQNLLGISDKAQRYMQSAGKAEANRMSVKLELQADFFAGVWAHHAHRMYNILEEGDIEEGLNAASAVGDDRLQQQSQGRVVPDAFTHGSSEQRMYWFKKGFQTGDMDQGDTFNSPDL